MASVRPSTVDGPADNLPAPLVARAITVFCLGSVALLSVVNVLSVVMEPVPLAMSLACVVIVFALQHLHCAEVARAWSVKIKVWTLGFQAVFTYLPMVVFSTGWDGMAGCLAASVLQAIGGRVAWLLFFAISASMAVLPPVLGATAIQTTYVALSTLLIGLVLYGLSRLTDLVAQVHKARGELARLAVAEERLRFARDLHDLLGYSLSAITLKSQLISRLIHSQPNRARDEVDSILWISRQAVADVRMVASGYWSRSLLSEVASARAILTDADVEVEVTVRGPQLPPEMETVLAATFREGVTNILRHSAVRSCQITLVTEPTRVRLTLVNDGVLERRSPKDPHCGSGLDNLAARVAAIGGRLVAGPEENGTFRLLVEAPICPERAAAALAQDVAPDVAVV